jgi:hypothetical protein
MPVLVSDAVLVVGELVANAVEQSRPTDVIKLHFGIGTV